MKEHITFPSINQFRHVIKEVKHKVTWSGNDENGEPIFDRTKALPILDFVGTVKLHGTNASVVIDGDEIYFQSRNNIITPESDNAGFAAWATIISKDVWDSIYKSDEKVIIYGEWCGGNIQKGVAITGLPKMFVIFKVRVGDRWLPMIGIEQVVGNRPNLNIYKITDFNYFATKVDFNHPEKDQNFFKSVTEEVERECPVGKHFGVIGTGEGVVWTCVSEGFESSKFMFKVKGEKHSVTKVRTLAAVDTEKLDSLKAFAESVVTENRCQQGISYLKEQQLEVSEKSTGVFLKWLHADIIKEESDTIAENGFEAKEVGQTISKYGKMWFFEYLNK